MEESIMTSPRFQAPCALTQRTSVALAVWVLCATALSAVSMPARAGVTDIAAQPLATTPTVQAKPNLLFILDNSGSMDSDYMPDEMSSTGVYGYRSAQCNGVAYDPSVTYSPPIKADGSAYPNATFTAARSDGYDSSSTTTSLNNKYYFTYDKTKGSQPKMGWVYTTSGVTTNTFYNECYSTVGNTPGSNVFVKVIVTTTSTEAQNYANWYSYYRKRYLLMRTAMGKAIAALDSSYRVGFSTISDTSATDGTNYFRDVKDFDSTQKTNFYSSLYTVAPSSWTPLRAALAKAGRYYANKASGQTYDPMQYSCQRNYALLSTDGYWNAHDESSTYGPFVLDADTNVGSQDAAEARPMRDASRAIVTTTTPYTASATRDKKSNTQTRSRTWSRNYTVYAATKGTGGCSSSKFLKTVQAQTFGQSQTQWFVTPQVTTYTYNNTLITTEGVTTSNTDSTPAAGTWNTAPGASATVTPTDTGDATGSSTFNNSGGPSTSCVTTAGTTGYSTATAGSWSSWSPSLTYTYPNLVIGSYTAGTASVVNSFTGDSFNALADVAEYYWKTDIRNSDYGNCTSSSSGTSRDVCEDIVRPVTNDANKKQHMNSFTIGLGVSGTLTYDKNYPTQVAGDYVDLINGTKNWPNPSDGGEAVNIDDLWHAGVNGRGRYYSALSATELSEAISGVVSDIAAIPGAAAAAATSTLELVSGDNNQIFSASYTTKFWSGDLKSYGIDGKAVISTTPTWSAQTKLDTLVSSATLGYASRKIYFKGTSGLTLFTYDNLDGTQQGYFTNLCSKSVVSGQCATLSTTDKALANSGTNLVNYLRGERTYETAGSTVAALYRARDHVLGDIINGAPVYVGKPPFSYADAGYADFITAKRSRKPVVYVAANDGMLHAISAATTDGGTELWAFMPSAVMPNLYKLADNTYGNKHQYFVDGAPVMGDVKIGSDWKTIVVGGLNRGGSSYYALDITDPAAPVMLWEFTDANMGLTYGNPIITKRQDGTWVVVVTSGLNNTSGDGKGHLYVLNAGTGSKLLDLVTTEGSTTTPSGLNKINAWVDSTTDNTALRFYGGDMLGNLWRFDTDGRYAAIPAATQLAKFQIDTSTPQPVTTKPLTASVSGAAVVIVGTGRYLGETDITDTTRQSIYAVRDPLGTTGWGSVHGDTTNFTKQIMTLNNTDETKATSATITSNRVDWTKGGWWLDLPHTRERVAINMGMQLSTLAIGTAIPTGDACASGGSSWRYYLGLTTGSAIPGSDSAGARWSPNTLIVGISWVKDADGNVRTVFQDSDGTLRTEVPPTSPGAGSGAAHRTSWRELID